MCALSIEKLFSPRIVILWDHFSDHFSTQLYSYGNTAYMGYTVDRIFFSQTVREKVHAGRRFPLC